MGTFTTEPRPTYAITVLQGANGTITPAETEVGSGIVNVLHGATQQFTITAATNYHINTLSVDGIQIPAAVGLATYVYTFTNVTAPHSITATFAPNTYAINAVFNPTIIGGTGLPNFTSGINNSMVTYGTDVTLQPVIVGLPLSVANVTYSVAGGVANKAAEYNSVTDSWTILGADLTGVVTVTIHTGATTYTLTHVIIPTTIASEFPVTNVSGVTNGKVTNGIDYYFTIAPADARYAVGGVTYTTNYASNVPLTPIVGGIHAGQYMVPGTAIASNLTIIVTYVPQTYTLTWVNNGIVTFNAGPSLPTTATYGTNIPFSAIVGTIPPGYQFDKIAYVIGTDTTEIQQLTGSYTLQGSDIVGNVTIVALSKPATYNITINTSGTVTNVTNPISSIATAGVTNTATPTVNQMTGNIAHGTNVVLTITPPMGHEIVSVIGTAGSLVGNEFTIPGANITSNIAVNVTYAPKVYEIMSWVWGYAGPAIPYNEYNGTIFEGTNVDIWFQDGEGTNWGDYTYGDDIVFTVPTDEIPNYHTLQSVSYTLDEDATAADMIPLTPNNGVYTISAADFGGADWVGIEVLVKPTDYPIIITHVPAAAEGTVESEQISEGEVVREVDVYLAITPINGQYEVGSVTYEIGGVPHLAALQTTGIHAGEYLLNGAYITGDVDVIINYVAADYTFTVTSDPVGTATATNVVGVTAANKVAYGTQVTFDVDVTDANYEFESVTYTIGTGTPVTELTESITILGTAIDGDIVVVINTIPVERNITFVSAPATITAPTAGTGVTAGKVTIEEDAHFTVVATATNYDFVNATYTVGTSLIALPATQVGTTNEWFVPMASITDDITVTANYAPKTFSFTITGQATADNLTGATIGANGATYGDNIEFELIPNTNYTVTSVTYEVGGTAMGTLTPILGGVYEILGSVITDDVEVIVNTTFVGYPIVFNLYDITSSAPIIGNYPVTPVANITGVAGSYAVMPMTTVQFDVPNNIPNYSIDYVTYTINGVTYNASQAGTPANRYYFSTPATMTPAGVSVTVNYEFSPVAYAFTAVVAPNPTTGTITVTGGLSAGTTGYAVENTAITFTATANTNYAVASVTYKIGAAGTPITLLASAGVYTVPASAVTGAVTVTLNTVPAVYEIAFSYQGASGNTVTPGTGINTGTIPYTAEYNTSAYFTAPTVPGRNLTSITYTINGAGSYAPVNVSGYEYYIPGASITGNIQVTLVYSTGFTFTQMTIPAGTGLLSIQSGLTAGVPTPGTNITFTATANANYNVASVTYQIGTGSEITITPAAGIYTVPGAAITNNVTVRLYTTPQTHSINFTYAGTTGSVTNGTGITSGTVVTFNTDAHFTVNNVAGWNIANVTYTVGTNASAYTATQVGTSNEYYVAGTAITDDIHVLVTYTNIQYTFNYIAVPTSSATLSIANGTLVNHGSAITFTATPIGGSTVDVVTYTVAGNPMGTLTPNAGNYTIPAVNVTGPIVVTVNTVVSTTPTITAITRAGVNQYVNGGGTTGTTTYNFNVAISNNTVMPTTANFTVVNGTITSVSGTASNAIVTVLPNPTAGTTIAGTEFYISASTIAMPSVTPERYNIRRTFMATATLTPANAATNVAVSGNISIGYSEIIEGSTTINVTLNGGNVALTKSGNSFVGSYSGLANSTTYNVTNTTFNVNDRWGNNATFPATWSFQTTAPVTGNPTLVSLTASGESKRIRFTWTSTGGTGMVVLLSRTPIANPTTPASITGLTSSPTGEPAANGTYAYFADGLSGSALWLGLTKNTAYYVYAWETNNGATYSTLNTAIATTSKLKEGFSESVNGSFAVSEITPSPAVENAGFDIATLTDGSLNVVVLDLSGSVVMNVVNNEYIGANTETRIPLNFSKLASGMYSVMISVGDDRVVRTIVVSK
jgi:hypothetical protein